MTVVQLQDGGKAAILQCQRCKTGPDITETAYLFQLISGKIPVGETCRISFYVRGIVPFDGGSQQSFEILLVGNGWVASKKVTAFTSEWTQHITNTFVVGYSSEALHFYFDAAAVDNTRWCPIFVDTVEVIDSGNNVVAAINDSSFESGSLYYWGNYSSDNIKYAVTNDCSYSGNYCCKVFRV